MVGLPLKKAVAASHFSRNLSITELPNTPQKKDVNLKNKALICSENPPEKHGIPSCLCGKFHVLFASDSPAFRTIWLAEFVGLRRFRPLGISPIRSSCLPKETKNRSDFKHVVLPENEWSLGKKGHVVSDLARRFTQLALLRNLLNECLHPTFVLEKWIPIPEGQVPNFLKPVALSSATAG